MFVYFLLVFFALGVNADPNPPVLEIPDIYFSTLTTDAKLHPFYPKGVTIIHKFTRAPLQYGDPSPHIQALIDHVESIPVEERLTDLYYFAAHKQSLSAARKASTWYQRYLVASSFIDVRLFRLLVRVASRNKDKDERELKSACDIIEHMRTKFPDGSFDYLTPDYVLEWYYGFGGSLKLRSNARKHTFRILFLTNEEVQTAIHSRDPQKQILVRLSPTSWNAMILDKRIVRLRNTGYESLCESPTILLDMF